ncbi:hypothetical protein F5884DRAFT_679427 [Xylogone sp. PMI_703]|nr:hypothetical protein F5884DRAFT_679427 [Xylogone sp. PMI_703]
MLVFTVAVICLTWFVGIFLVQTIGITQLYRYYSSAPKPAVSPTLDSDDIPHVTIIRPVKGLEPQLYECLASTFRQAYPQGNLTVYFCIATAEDPAYPVLRRLLKDFPLFDARVFIEEEDPNLSGHGGEATNLGPNPKIRNMSRSYREAKGDIIWIIDCNVWVGPGVAGRMVDKLCGFRSNGTRARPYKFVHQLPLVVDGVGTSVAEERQRLPDVERNESNPAYNTFVAGHDTSNAGHENLQLDGILRTGGGRLEEMFMASSHAKFYTAINTVAIAPCIVGKSNMFRRSHLDALTSEASRYSPGIDYFSDNICEDHLIGDLLWRKKVPAEKAGEKFYKHGLVYGDLAIQPMAQMSVKEYIARRVRWLRVRKFTVTLATLVEPGVEPLLCSAYGAFAFTTLPWFHDKLGILQTWTAFALIWAMIVTIWMTCDWFVYSMLHSGASIELDTDTPSFARPLSKGRRSLREWIGAWLGREILTLPIWTWAFYGGTSVTWRGKRFTVHLNMKVEEIKSQEKPRSPKLGGWSSKNRLD